MPCPNAADEPVSRPLGGLGGLGGDGTALALGLVTRQLLNIGSLGMIDVDVSSLER
ncbi:hypothetical protein [Streptomyces bluensis]|uniref:hypothetical protein n=1 Tax=Streptomyces bluensis TaxID=33897 RepID=UPI0033234DCF